MIYSERWTERLRFEWAELRIERKRDRQRNINTRQILKQTYGETRLTARQRLTVTKRDSETDIDTDRNKIDKTYIVIQFKYQIETKTDKYMRNIGIILTERDRETKRDSETERDRNADRLIHQQTQRDIDKK